MSDMVNHPKHYQAKNGMEAIDVIEAFTDGLNGIEATDTGNIIKYALRWNEKNGVEDLKKIVWYANHLINHLEKQDARTMRAKMLSVCLSNALIVVSISKVNCHSIHSMSVVNLIR